MPRGRRGWWNQTSISPASPGRARDERSRLVASGERIALRGARERLLRELAVGEHNPQLAARPVARFPEDIGVAQHRALPRHLEPALGPAAGGGLSVTAGGGLSGTASGGRSLIAGGGESFTTRGGVFSATGFGQSSVNAGGGRFITAGDVGRSVLGSGGDREEARQYHCERSGTCGGGLPTLSHRPP